MFELTIKTDNPAVLVAIANAVKNTPPIGYVEGKPGVVNIHASLKDMKAAKEALEVAIGTEINEVPMEDEPKPTPPPPPTPKAPPANADEARNERRTKLRKLVTEAGEKLDGGIPAAMALAVAKAGVKESKDLPDCANFDEVCEVLVAASKS